MAVFLGVVVDIANVVIISTDFCCLSVVGDKVCSTNDDEHSNVESSLQSSNLLYVT